MNCALKTFALFLAILLFLTGTASAQWVTLGRKAVGKIRQLSSEMQSGGAAGEARDSRQTGYDVATVLLEARADKVYDTAVDILQSKKDWTVTHTDKASRTIQFTDKTISAGLQVTLLDDNLSQILIASTVIPGRRNTVSLAVDSILRICGEMGIHCQPER